MECKDALENLSAYIDGELDACTRGDIQNHLLACNSCNNEHEAVLRRDSLMFRMDPIKPSSGFRDAFWEKVDAIETQRAGCTEGRSLLLDWLPTPVMGILLIVITLFTFSFSLAVSATSQSLQNAVILSTVKRFVISPGLFNPSSVLSFCKDTCSVVCKCARKQVVSSECICGGCDNMEGGN